ncbi:OmpA family protein [Erythrobacter crassostreae]|uniref:OmpA family protein n=1 Tax=Erythrobacter crassostreae TaxID=2828328 RepID=A0A9X1F427_9SPHN|nr:OmpA family protein [Erythrobacter crassostrea]MBV7259727.1 OmpA family protein [Erythrobacter crassostrea]
MKKFSLRSRGLAAAAVVSMAAPAALTAQDQGPVRVSAQTQGDVLTTVTGSPPADLSGLTEGPEIEGLISARDGDRLQVTSADGTSTVVTIGSGTVIKAKGGFLGLGRTALTEDALLNGLPVSVETVEWANRLVATEVGLKNKDLKTAAMIRSGTNQRFEQQGARITENTVATEALRGRFGDIDQYNVKGTTNVYFDSGKYNLSAESRSELCQAASQAEGMSNALLLVVGYTDSTGSYEINQELSEKRAGRVVNFLQQECSWKPYRMLTPTGMAASDPAADNDTAYGKAQNRRVAVNILVSKSAEGLN